MTIKVERKDPMDNSFYKLLKGKFNDAELELSLKSCVPLFLVYPELIANENYKLEDVIPYYFDEMDYNNKSVFIPLNGSNDLGEKPKFVNKPGHRDYTNNKVLGIIFESLLRRVVNSSIKGDSKVKKLPKLSVLIDIGPDESKRKVIKIKDSEIKDFDNLKQSLHTFSDHITANMGSSLTDVDKNNLLLLNKLQGEFNDLGTTGGR